MATEIESRSTAARRTRAGRTGLAAAGLLILFAMLHIAYLLWNCPLDLSGDEAHYWEWSRRLDLSYYSKGPLVAYLIAGGRVLFGDLSRALLGNDVLAVRGPAVVLSLLTGWGLYVLGARGLGRPKLGLAAVALTATVPVLAVGAILLTIDAPLACCFVWTLAACARGLERDELWPWLVAGVLIALGILAKYNMLLVFPAVGLTILTVPEYRRHLARPGPYMATGIGFLGLVPILIWNSHHGWVSFRHVAGQAGVAEKAALNFAGPVEFLAGQAAVIGPIWFALLICAGVSLWRRPQSQVQAGEQHSSGVVRLLLFAAIVPYAAFLAFSPITKVQPNWPVVGVLPGLLLLTLWLARRLRDVRAARLTRGLIVAGVGLGAPTVLFMHYTQVAYPLLRRVLPKPVPWNLTPAARVDPTARLRGWSELGAAVGRQLEAERAAGREPFIVADDYQVASQIAFYCPGNPVTYSVQAVLGGRQSQYDMWPNPIREPERFRGKPCMYVGARKSELIAEGEDARGAALRGVRLVETVTHKVQGMPVQIWPIFVADEYVGFSAEVLQRWGRKH